MKILAIGGSNSKNSINRRFAKHTAGLFKDSTVKVYDVSTKDVPLFSLQYEEINPSQPVVNEFIKEIDDADFIVISLAENNGSYNAGFKNLMDWVSRDESRKTWGNKPMLLMATSPGGRGGIGVLEAAKSSFPHLGAEVKASFSLPKFQDNFDDATGITNPELKKDLDDIITSLS